MRIPTSAFCLPRLFDLVDYPRAICGVSTDQDNHRVFVAHLLLDPRFDACLLLGGSEAAGPPVRWCFGLVEWVDISFIVGNCRTLTGPR